MPSLKDIRGRITSVQSTMQITRAMKLVAAAKLRRAQERIEAQRPYAYELRSMIRSLAERADENAHPLLHRRPMKRVDVLVLTSDRGLCGGFNMNICRAVENYLADHDEHEDTGLVMVGKKGKEYFKRRPEYTIRNEYTDVLFNPDLDHVSQIGRDIVERYENEGLDGVLVVYNEFKTAASQRVVVEQLLPIVPEDFDDEDGDGRPEGGEDNRVEHKFEPDQAAILNGILPLHVNIQIWRAVLESLASEMGARMTAMGAATSNASDILDKLKLQYNRARQESITNELIEIMSGAEALKG